MFTFVLLVPAAAAARHILVLEVLEPSLDNIIAAYFNRKPSSVWYESRVVWLMCEAA